MKKQLIKLVVILPAFLFSLTSCEKYRCFEGSGDVKTETRYLNDFKQVEVDLSADVEVIYDSALTAPKVIIKAREDVLEKIETEVGANALLIDSRRCISSDSPVEIKLYVNELECFDLDGSGNVHSSTLIPSDDFELNLSGSGDIDLELDVEDLITKISGSGNIDLSGEADFIDAKVSGSGNIKAASFITKNAEVKISGSGNVKVYASDNLQVKITGSGNVYYKGEPDVDVKITGSGDVMKF